MKAEKWVDIGGYEGLYKISNFGNVLNSKGVVMKPRKDKDGYLLVNLFKNGKSTTFKIHRLVALGFIPNVDKTKNEINHKDEKKSNNAVDNLEWCDHKYNNQYGSKPLKVSEKKSMSVHQIDLTGNVIKTHNSTRQIERDMGYRHENISACCLGKYKTAYGFVWKYA